MPLNTIFQCDHSFKCLSFSDNDNYTVNLKLLNIKTEKLKCFMIANFFTIPALCQQSCWYKP